MVFNKCQNSAVSCENSILLEALFMILYDIIGEKSMVKDLNFVQFVQMPEDECNLIELYELQWYIDNAN
jgi:hypothetical protein